MSKSWECALALRRAVNCRKRVSIPFAARTQSRSVSQVAQTPIETLSDASTGYSTSVTSKARVDWRNKDSLLSEHLNKVFSPLQFPPELARRILTHASHPDASLSHNGRLSFVGRRVLQSYLLMFVHSSPALQPDHDYEKILAYAINTYTLGEHVAPKWELGKVLKWRPMNVGNLSKPLGPDIDVPSPLENLEGRNARSVGMYKVHGTTVEAVVGGVFHQFGGAVAHRLFHTRLLPHLCIEGSLEGLHGRFHEHALEICQKMGGRTEPLLR
ncbi:ribonuclease-III-like-domain-containing protein [Fomes fomentarius]|nr:ribonuclease-III-like-domain-containing protein [Fomes fomentarius]